MSRLIAMESISHWAENIKQSTPTVLLVGFGVIGFLAVAGKVRSYIRLLLSIFVIRGKNVSLHLFIYQSSEANRVKVTFVWQEGFLGTHYGCL